MVETRQLDETRVVTFALQLSLSVISPWFCDTAKFQQCAATHEELRLSTRPLCLIAAWPQGWGNDILLSARHPTSDIGRSKN